MKSPEAEDYVLGVVGAGAMGQGIAQVAAQGGLRVLLVDAAEGAAEKGAKTIAGRFDRLVEKGRMGEDDAKAASSRVEAVGAISDLGPCDAVVEAVVEKIEVKHEVFRQIEAAVSEDCLITSNTSSIPIASLARVCERRDRVAGLHFFNPVPLMKLVEVIRAAETSDAAVEALTKLGERLTRVPVVVKDSPGFLVNMGGRAFTTEALRIAHENVARPEQVDAIMKDCWGFRMGPFELMDLTGIDVNYPVSQIVWEGYQQDRRLATSPNHRALYDAGLFGRKSGQGWYGYEGGKPKDPPSPDHATDRAPATRVALAPDAEEELPASAFPGGPAGTEPEGDDALAAFCEEIGLEVVEDDGDVPVLAAPIGTDASTLAAWGDLDHRRLVCVDLTGDVSKRVTLMTAPGAFPEHRDAVAAAIARAGRKVTAITDSPGFVGQRMCAMIANLGCYMAEIGLATPADIDTAMQLGLNYPRGPLALAEALGTEVTLEILEELEAATGDDRYRPTLWLKRRAMLGLPVDTPA